MKWLLAAAALAAGGTAQKPPSFPMVHYTLDNGLEVVLQPDPTVTTAVVDIWYRVGSKDEEAGRTGLAHLFEHLMFEGSKHVPQGDFDRLLETAGGWNNADTSSDRTNYFEQVPANFLELALWLEADRMAGLWDAMTPHVVDEQRDVVKNEFRESILNQPYGAAQLDIEAALWPDGHGYHHDTIGSMKDLTAASIDDVGGFWKKWYRPSNAILVIVGGIDVDATKKLVDQYFGWMPKEDAPAYAAGAEVTPLDTPADLTATDQVEAAKVSFSFRGDPAYTAGAADLEVATHILGEGQASRLYKRLVFQDRVASEVYAYVDERTLGSVVEIDAIVKGGVDPEKVKTEIADEIADLRDHGPTDDEVERAERSIESSRLAGLENIASRAAAIASWTALTGDPDHLAAELELLRAVTRDSVKASAARWLGAKAAVTMVVTGGKK